ncbi:hypothetical protein ACWC09_10505 [Streptomyces sp. NPDC001617]
MRRTARVLSAVALAGAALGVTGTAAFADPAAEVSPSTVSPGSSVTVSVSCGAVGGQAPATIDATSQAFDQDTVELQRVPGNDDQASGPAYRGTARIAQAADLEAGGPNAGTPGSAWTVDGTCPAAPGAQGSAWSTTLQVDRGTGAAGTGPASDRPCDESTAECGSQPCDESATECGSQPCAEPRTDCSAQPCDESATGCSSQPCAEPRTDCASRPCADSRTDCGNQPCADARTDCRTQPCDQSRTDACGAAVIQRGVQAGEGGAFTDSVPALVAGGILIAGALGAAVHRLRHRDAGPGH